MERNSLTFLTIFILNSMIAKILKPSFNFQAVYYNEQKITEQKAELMAAVNFEGSLRSYNEMLGLLTDKAKKNEVGY